MALVKIDILNHADYGGEFRKTPMAPGLSKFYSAIESIRSKNRDNCLLLDAGDNINRILWHGKEVMDGLALINTDCMTLGNHEFDKGRENLEECIEHICNKMDILCCNIVYKDSKQLIKNVKPYTIIEKNNIKYGIIGVTTSYTPYMVEKEAFSQFEVLDEYQQLMKYLPEVKKQSDLLIILAHMPFYFTDESESGDLIDLYYKIKQFKPDVMIGGHIPQDYCRVVDDCVICKGGFSGKSLPHCQLTYDTESKKVVDRKCEVIDVIHSDFEGDKTVDEFVKKVTSKYDYYFDEVLGVAKEEIDMRLSRESHLGNFICDAVKEITKADFVYFNCTSCGYSLAKGDITRFTISEAMGFNDNLQIGSYSGKDIYDLFSEVMMPERFGNNGNIMFAGVNVVIDNTKKYPNKVVSLTKEDGTMVKDDDVFKV
ncbi:MAG: 5'-nucleotidase C-terminal domain-containing protein, partial [Erysipelotrichaceae bacterium]|nr:5'-nucleotidase C-terminal domain-containing protein [Erysipelotrichaceae bacterium]